MADPIKKAKYPKAASFIEQYVSLPNYRKVFIDENQINEHIVFIKKEISRSNKEHRMLELKNWLQCLNGN